LWGCGRAAHSWGWMGFAHVDTRSRERVSFKNKKKYLRCIGSCHHTGLMRVLAHGIWKKRRTGRLLDSSPAAEIVVRIRTTLRN
jgi:hypothetical protein